jgi:hypothetical protein
MIQFTAPANDGGSDITNYQYSTDNGATWVTPSPAVTESPLIISSGLSNCTTYPIQIRAVNAAGGGTATAATNLTPRASTNVAINWVSRTASAANLWGTVTYANGLFVAVSSTGSGNRVMTSPDGITWTARTSAANNSWRSVTYGNGLFVAVSIDGTGNRVMTSPDGIAWTVRTSAADNQWTGVTFGNGQFVAVSLDGTNNRVMTNDNIVWTVDAPVITSISDQNNSASVVFTQTASSYAPTISNYEYSTDNGSTWTARNPASSLSPMFISGLSNGTTYNIKIRAINGGGTSCESNAMSVTPALAAPTNVLLTPLNTGGMIQFIAPEVFGGSAITNYEYSTDNEIGRAYF